MKIAEYWNLKEDKVECSLCPRGCIIAEGKKGFCRGRENIKGKLYAINYGRYTSIAVDPIEKKPLYHFYPSSDILSIGGLGCNLGCNFCQNWHISHSEAEVDYITPEKLIDLLIKRYPASIGIAFTYNEPLIWFEFIKDCSVLLRKYGKKVVLVSNGYINPVPFFALAPFIDAMNIDLKGFSEEFYHKYCLGKLSPVMETITSAYKLGIWVEVTLLLIPSANDSENEVREMCNWLSSVSNEIPFHISRYFPNYKLDYSPTAISRMKEVYKIAKEKLKYVYLGNVPDLYYNSTRCPECDSLLISRVGYDVKIENLSGRKCLNCGQKIALGE